MCPECAELMDTYFITVKNYLYDHPDSNLFETAKATGVPENIVLGFLREGRLSVSGMGNFLECEKCGAPIPSGRYCLDCQAQLEEMLSNSFKSDGKVEPQRNAAARMHVNYRE